MLNIKKKYEKQIQVNLPFNALKPYFGSIYVKLDKTSSKVSYLEDEKLVDNRKLVVKKIVY